MILEAIINVFFGVATTVMNFLPTFDFGNIGGATAIATSLVAVSAFMPVSALSLGIFVFVSINMFKFASSLLNWIIRKIPTID